MVAKSLSSPGPRPARQAHGGTSLGMVERLAIGPREVDGARAIVNLAGRTVDCIKTPDHCDEILRSRVESTRVLGAACRQASDPPPVWVQMSTAHLYGDSVEVTCDEESPFGYGLAPFVGRAWEEAFADAVPESTRGVVLRTSFVIGRSGGALPKLAGLARWGSWRDYRQRPTGDELGPRARHESDLRASDLRRVDERVVHRDGAKSRLERRIHA